MDSRQSAKWCKEQVLAADDNSVGTDELIDSSVTTAKILDKNVTLAKIQDVTADRMLGRLATDGTVQQLTASQTAGLLQSVTWSFSGTVTFSGTTSFTSTTTFSGNVGFFSHAAVAQQSSPVTVTITTVSGTGDDLTVNGNFTALANAINTVRTALLNLGLTA
jgi:hypothetical protein